MDYAAAVWNEQIDNCIYELGLALSVAQSIVSEMHSLQAVCNSLRRLETEYQELDRADVEIVANKFRDAIGHEVSAFIRTLKAAADMTSGIYEIMAGVAAANQLTLVVDRY